MRVGSYHHSARKSIVLKYNLMDNSGSRFPETDSVAGRYVTKEIVHFFIGQPCSGNIFFCTFIRLYQMVTMHRRRHSNLIFARIHKLKQSHLGCRILHRNTVGTKIYIIFPSLVIFHIIQMGIQNFLGQRQRTFQYSPYVFYLSFISRVESF